MDSIVDIKTNTIVTNVNASNSVVSREVERVVEEGNHNTIVIHGFDGTILTEVKSTNILVTGLIGPVGPSAEEIEVYSKRIDFISDTELYKGEASAGSSESSAVWRIRKILIAGDGDVSETWAGGTTNFDKIWANRISLIYS